MGKQAKQQASAQSRKGFESSPPAGVARGTGERDEHYDIISVLYHSLQGVETVGQYLQDAQRAGDEELLSFLQETRQEYVQRAKLAKQLLIERSDIDEMDEDEDEEDEEDEED